MVIPTQSTHPLFELPELHAHVASSIPPNALWHIAHSEGYKLPKREYHDFVNYVVLSPTRKLTLKEYLTQVYHPILDKLSSGAVALEMAVFETLSGAYRSSNITLYELRGNPMKHNKDGEVDLDHAIMAMLRGMERALLEYPRLRAGLIFCMDRHFSLKQNTIIVEKAIKYHRRGVVGIDFSNYGSKDFHYRDYAKLVERAREAGLRVTAHTGETDDTNDMEECVKYIKPDRIGHGIKAARNPALMKTLAAKQIHLEVCPFSNIMTKAVHGDEEMKEILNTLYDNGVRFSINTDWPETIENAHLNRQVSYLLEHEMLTESQMQQTIEWGFDASFIPKKKGEDNLYL